MNYLAAIRYTSQTTEKILSETTPYVGDKWLTTTSMRGDTLYTDISKADSVRVMYSETGWKFSQEAHTYVPVSEEEYSGKKYWD